jgi:hypothetical protein
MTELLTAPNQPDFRLLRMILLDSYSPGGEAIINLRDGAIMTGENGAGKTSLIRLVPIFFGENPGRVTVGTEGFVDFYLGRTTSYVIFEYARRDVICQSVLYAGNENSYTFQFIRSGYDLAQFTTGDGKSIVQSHALSTHLKTNGVPHSRQLPLHEYRNTIQGRPTAGRDAAVFRAYVNDYAFTSGNQRLDHIDKILSGMFKRQAEFKDFLRLVVSYITNEEKETPIAVSGDRNRIGKWPEHYAAYQEVMRHSEHMGEINGLGATLVANDEELQVLHAKFLVLIDHHEQQAKQLSAAKADAINKVDDAREPYERKRGDFLEKEAGLNEKAKAAAEAVANLYRQEAEYRSIGIADKAQLVASLQPNQEKAETIRARKKALLGAQAEIDSKYTGLKQTVEQSFLTRQARISGQRTAVENEFTPRFAAIDKAQRAAEDDARELADKAREAAQEEHGKAIADLAHWRAIAANPPVAPNAIKELEAKQAALKESREKLVADGKKMEEAKKAKDGAIGKFEDQDKAVREVVQKLGEQQKAVEKLVATASPAEGSLLGHLREHSPEWTQNIAKVIHPDLLQRTDLSPSSTDGDISALYGLSLDLSRVETPMFADETLIQREIETTREVIGLLQKNHEAEKSRLAALNAVRTVAQDAFLATEGAVAKASADVEAKVSDEQAAIRSAEASKKEAGRQASEQATAANARVQVSKGVLGTIQSRLKRDLAAIATGHGAQVDAIRAEKTATLNKLSRELIDAEADKNASIKELNTERDKALAKDGVDTEALEKLESELKSVTDDISEGVLWAERVAGWRLWCKNEWTRIGQLAGDEAEHKKQAGRVSDKRKTHEEEWAVWLKSETRRINEMGDGALRSEKLAMEAWNKLPRIDDFPPHADTLKAHYEASWTIEELTGRMNSLFSKRRVCENDIKTRVREVKSAFRNGHGSPVEQYFETIAGTIDPDDENPRAWIQPLREWYDGRHEEFLRTLLLDGQTFGRLICRFHHDVDQFNAKIREFNRNMRGALGSTVVFRRISQISIEFISTVDEKAYWKPIKEFVEAHQGWIDGIGRELPPPSFSEGIKRLMDHWEVREGIRADRVSLIDVRGEVVENGKLKSFVDGPGLKELSSNGLSYLILTTICVAFLRMIRGDAKVQLTIAVDELLDLDVRNIGILVQMLRDNGIDLVSACPDAAVDVMTHFPNRYRVIRNEDGPEIQQAVLAEEMEYV